MAFPDTWILAHAIHAVLSYPGLWSALRFLGIWFAIF